MSGYLSINLSMVTAMAGMPSNETRLAFESNEDSYCLIIDCAVINILQINLPEIFVSEASYLYNRILLSYAA